MSQVSPPHPVLTAEALDAIYAHARREHPNECCGIVYGPKAQPSAARAVACVNIQNELHAEDPTRHTRDARTAYNLGAGDLFKLGKSLRGDEPAKIVYHSHVDVERADGAYFSDTDQAAAHDGGRADLPRRVRRRRPAPRRCAGRGAVRLEPGRQPLRRDRALPGTARAAVVDCARSMAARDSSGWVPAAKPPAGGPAGWRFPIAAALRRTFAKGYGAAAAARRPARRRRRRHRRAAAVDGAGDRGRRPAPARSLHGDRRRRGRRAARRLQVPGQRARPPRSSSSWRRSSPSTGCRVCSPPA